MSTVMVMVVAHAFAMLVVAVLMRVTISATDVVRRSGRRGGTEHGRQKSERKDIPEHAGSPSKAAS
jgi:hypothetical protein